MSAEFLMQEAEWRLERLRREAEQDRLVLSCRPSRRSIKEFARAVLRRRTSPGGMPAPVVTPLFGMHDEASEERAQARCA